MSKKPLKYVRSFLMVLIFSSSISLSQDKIEINGKVVDEDGNSLSYVNVYRLNSFDGAMTNEKGQFSFYVPAEEGTVIVASLIGYKKFEMILTTDTLNNKYLLIQLERTSVETNEVIITASSYGTEEDNGVVLTGMDVITTPGGAADIFQTLKTLPGVTQVSESAQLYVRGGDPIETITLMDQASLYHPYTYESAYGGLFSNINSSTIKGMYFSCGGFSAKYGNALSGVLELQTKNEPQECSYMLGVSLAGAELTAQMPVFSDNIGLRINGKRSFTKPIFWLNGGVDEFTLLPVSSDINASVTHKISETGRIKLFGSFADDREGVKVNLAGYSDEFSGSSTNYLLNLQFSEILFENTIVKASISNSVFNSIWRLGILDLIRKDNGWKFRADAESVISSKFRYLAGFEIENRDATYTGIIPEDDFDLRGEADGKVINSTFGVTRFGGYSEFEISNLFGIKNLFTRTGLRADLVTPLSLFWVDPRVGISYKLNDDLTLSAAWGVFHQHPDPRLYSQLDGNSYLEEMKASHFIISLDYNISNNNTLRMEAYHKEYSNLPLKDPEINYSNNGYGFAKGIDIMMKGKWFNDIDGWVSYGFISTKRLWMDFNEFTSSTFDITHNFTLVATYRLTESLMVGINYKYATGRPFTPVISSNYIEEKGIYEPVDGGTNSERLPDYHRLDLRLTYLIQLFNNYFTVFYIEGINILDIKNIFGYSYNRDYTRQINVNSYFGRRTVVLGMQITM